MAGGVLYVDRMKGTQMDSQLKLGAVLLGGYLLGRTKKGGMATRMALRMAASGQDIQPGELAKDNAIKLLHSDLVAQLRGQMVEVAKAAFDARVAALAQNLTDRTQALQSGTEKVTDTAGDTAGQATDTATDTVSGATDTLTGKDKEKSDDTEDQAGEPNQDSEASEGDTADDQPEPDDQPEGDGSDGSEAEPEEPVDEVSDEGGGMTEEPDSEESTDPEDGVEEEPEPTEPTDETDSDEDTSDEADSDEADSDEDKEQALQDRIKELKSRSYKVADLREMAKEYYEDEPVEEASKSDLATWIAEAEAEDEDGDQTDEGEG